MRKKPISEILEASRLLLFENNNETYPYSLGGSAFLIKVEDQIFAVTAKHVLSNNNYFHNDVCIRYNEKSLHFLPFDKIFGFDSRDNEDTDHKDIIFLKVAKTHFDKSIDTGFVIELPKKRSASELICNKLLITGFSRNLSEIDFDKKHMSPARKVLMGYDPKPTQYRGLFSFKYGKNDRKETDLDGLSGAPVFCLNSETRYYRIEGMLIRENYYLAIDAIHSYLTDIMNKI